VAGATQASDRLISRKCIDDDGKCTLDGSGKYPINKDDVCAAPFHYGTGAINN
jgi:hypothetical protein